MNSVKTVVSEKGKAAYDKTKAVYNDVWAFLMEDTPALLAGHAKETLAVFTFLLCNSRIGSTDFLATPFIMFAVLIAYDMPFINPAVWMAIRLGPNYSGLVPAFGTAAEPTPTRNHLKNTVTLITMLIFQILGIIVAAAARQNMNTVFGVEQQSPHSYSGIHSLVLISTNQSDTTCSGTTTVPYMKNQTIDSACFTPSAGLDMNSWFVLEEFGEQFILCIAITSIFSTIDRELMIGRISYVSGVMLGLNYAFPTSLHGIHMILYYIFLQMMTGTDMWYTTTELQMRFLGSLLGTILAVLCYNWLDILDSMKPTLSVFKKETYMKDNKPIQPWLNTKIERYQLLRTTP
jgi:hypothetical protein